MAYGAPWEGQYLSWELGKTHRLTQLGSRPMRASLSPQALSPTFRLMSLGRAANGTLTLSNVAIGAPILSGQSVAVQSFDLMAGNQ